MLTMGMKKLIVGVAVVAAPVVAMAQSSDQLVLKYMPLVGNCEANAKALVAGLRDGTTFTLSSTACASSGGGDFLNPPDIFGENVLITPPTGLMGNGNVDIALTLAQRSLATINVLVGGTPPSQRPVGLGDLKAVLIGAPDSVYTPQGTSIQFPGILTLRSQNMGWGEISQQLNLNF